MLNLKPNGNPVHGPIEFKCITLYTIPDECDDQVHGPIKVKFITVYTIPDDDTLVLHVDHHVTIHVVCQCVHMGRVFILSLR